MAWNESGLVKGLLFMVLFHVLLQGDNAKLSPKQTKQPSARYRSLVTRKMSRLAELLEGVRGSVQLPMKDYRELIFEPPRNHSAFVLFYNDDDLCDMCGTALEHFQIIARTFFKQYVRFDSSTSKWEMMAPLFFVHVRMSDGPRNLLVDVDSSKPSLYYFAPSLSPKYNQFEKMGPQYSYSSPIGSEGGDMLEFIEYMTDLRIHIKEETRKQEIYSTIFTVVVFTTIMAIVIYRTGQWDEMVETLRQSNLSYPITVAVIWLLSGNMYNYINYVPFFGNFGVSFMSVIYPGMRSQFGAESVVIMILYAIVMYSIIALVEAREQQLLANLPIRHFQGTILGALSGFYAGFMGLQFISQIKTG